jgi:glycosyltransferase involved in cell wall biosynthesis
MSFSFEKIIFVLPSFKSGGAERVALNYIKFLAHTYNADLTAIVFRPKGSLTEEFKSIKNLEIINIEGSIFSKPSKNLTERKADLVISFLRTTNPFAMRLSKKNGAQVICREANPFVFKNMRLKPILVQFVVLMFYWVHRPTIIFNSIGTKKSFNWILPRGPKKIIYNPIFNKADLIARASISQNLNSFNVERMRQVVVVGRDVKQKNLHKALLVARYLHLIKPNEFMFNFYPGDTGLIPSNKKMAEQLENVKIMDFETPENIFQKADILLSTAEFEGFGNIFLEAIYYNTKIVAFRGKGSIKELLCDTGIGSCVASNEPNKLADQILQSDVTRIDNILLKSKELLEKCTVENFHMTLWGNN